LNPPVLVWFGSCANGTIFITLKSYQVGRKHLSTIATLVAISIPPETLPRVSPTSLANVESVPIETYHEGRVAVIK
jgi:hypothetical protein